MPPPKIIEVPDEVIAKLDLEFPAHMQYLRDTDLVEILRLGILVSHNMALEWALETQDYYSLQGTVRRIFGKIMNAARSLRGRQ